MPELPEVETTKRGIEPHVKGRAVSKVVVRQPQLRWPVPDNLHALLKGQKILSVERRAKYLFFVTAKGTLITHLGMSGSLRIVAENEPAGSHDHLDFWLETGKVMRYTDPRRFGAMLWTQDDPLTHKLLATLGPEPLSADFDGDYLYGRSTGRAVAVKQFIMDSHVVVGVGNIYANEALFMAGIHPKRAAGKISRQRYRRLVEAIRVILGRAIEQGGTTLRDFVGGEGKPGYFKQSLNVYGRGGESCKVCEAGLREIRIGQRSTVYCSHCQS